MARGGGVLSGPIDLTQVGVELWRTEDVATMPAILAGNSIALATGIIYGFAAKAKNGGTFGGVRVTGSVLFTGVTDMRAGVWAATLAAGAVTLGAKLAETASMGNLAAAANTRVALGSGITLTPGQLVILAMGGVGISAGQVRGLSIANSDANAHPLCWGATGYAGGALPTLTQGGAGSGLIPRLSLVA